MIGRQIIREEKLIHYLKIYLMKGESDEKERKTMDRTLTV